jgi:hypothetical protein
MNVEQTIDLNGYFTNIDDYKNLIIKLDDDCLNGFSALAMEYDGKFPLKDNYLRVKLDNWNKVSSNFNRFKPLLKKHIKITVVMKPYNFTKDDKNYIGCSAHYQKMTEA